MAGRLTVQMLGTIRNNSFFSYDANVQMSDPPSLHS